MRPLTDNNMCNTKFVVCRIVFIAHCDCVPVCSCESFYRLRLEKARTQQAPFSFSFSLSIYEDITHRSFVVYNLKYINKSDSDSARYTRTDKWFSGYRTNHDCDEVDETWKQLNVTRDLCGMSANVLFEPQMNFGWFCCNNNADAICADHNEAINRDSTHHGWSREMFEWRSIGFSGRENAKWVSCSSLSDSCGKIDSFPSHIEEMDFSEMMCSKISAFN